MPAAEAAALSTILVVLFRTPAAAVRAGRATALADRRRATLAAVLVAFRTM